MSDMLNIAIAGLGTVGTGTLQLLDRQDGLLAERALQPLRVVAVADLDTGRDRGVDLGKISCFDDALQMVAETDVDVVVELIGGSEGIAREVCEAAIAKGRHVITANKALLAHHGIEIAAQAEKAGVVLAYEAAVVGSVPIIKALREGLAGNRIARITGILNGTCNYILSAMRATGKEFDEVLAEAQSLGYAEADPSFDVDGVDAAHKLALLTAVAYGCIINFDGIYVEGIRHITARDIACAEELGYRIKLLGTTRRLEQGVEQRVHPCLIPTGAPLSHVEGVLNAVMVEGDFVGPAMFEGAGAGSHPTASAVVADMVDIARGVVIPTFGRPVTELEKMSSVPMKNHSGAYYIRLSVTDKPGVIADISAILRDGKISMESMLQHGRADASLGVVTVVMTTHETQESAMIEALAKIGALPVVEEPPCMIRIEQL
ncbi:MAG: homoserine dehydrogenase [Alphaproteobacteria bacterium]|jgi:homoserine dehydrogenase|nr:homoserine dehydrogenase [Rhodospirillaceae bacterium]MDP6031881.1 homoserine dehydrogenase [Alphaproteobacteria bacterium]MDP7183394.1 homoserine dehydrogenase [Alphaproteobacteria bacterium]MDP7190576.1 homoserine dehydrogenase [Alphaproteobacteria bacterium]HJO89267.1 homoserine dehydrogenase [Alphaproteobacteria bacterium]|tara:strand:- start:710 stop:2008 length:1299 start_codon:yes stop_codon:yes gene_type:complete